VHQLRITGLNSKLWETTIFLFLVGWWAVATSWDDIPWIMVMLGKSMVDMLGKSHGDMIFLRIFI